MGKIKSVEKTIKRVIDKIESGDYDTDVLIHMIDSIIKNRDRRLRHLEGKSRARQFVLTEKKISGALRDCIKNHGVITNKNIGSAAKRIHANCVELQETNQPVEQDPNASVDVIRNKSSMHKLTVASDGNVRIKIAIGSSIEEANDIITGFIMVAAQAQLLKESTLRGKVKLNDTHNSICLYNDSKNKHFNFSYCDEIS